MRRAGTATAMAGVLALVLTACGDRNDGEGNTPAATPRPSPSVSGTPGQPARADILAVIDGMMANATIRAAQVEAYAAQHGITPDPARLAAKKDAERRMAGRPRPIGGAEFMQDENMNSSGSDAP